ncbi:2'-5' RNA ligase family protein [soil metagenome]
MLTMGVAIAVPEPYGAQLRAWRSEFGDPMAETVPTHITLAPPIEVEEDEVEGVAERLAKAALDHEPFDICLRGTGTFRPITPVVYVAVATGHECIDQLARSVRVQLGSPALEFPFHPHVTVAQHLDEPALDRASEQLNAYECGFGVRSFSLYLHEEGSGWMPKRDFSLG